jgi:hypothetical protein
MTKKELLEHIKKDLELNTDNLETKLYEIPGLHSKYLGLYFNSKTKLAKQEKKLAQLYKEKWTFYKEESDELLDKKEIQFHILADEEYATLNMHVQILTDMVDVLDRTVKKVGNMSFDVKNLIAYLQYMQGV